MGDRLQLVVDEELGSHYDETFDGRSIQEFSHMQYMILSFNGEDFIHILCTLHTYCICASS